MVCRCILRNTSIHHVNSLSKVVYKLHPDGLIQPAAFTYRTSLGSQLNLYIISLSICDCYNSCQRHA